MRLFGKLIQCLQEARKTSPPFLDHQVIAHARANQMHKCTNLLQEWIQPVPGNGPHGLLVHERPGRPPRVPYPHVTVDHAVARAALSSMTRASQLKPWKKLCFGTARNPIRTTATVQCPQVKRDGPVLMHETKQTTQRSIA